MRCEDKWWVLGMSSHHLACTHPLCPSLAWEGIVNRPQCAHMPGKNCIFWQLLFTPSRTSSSKYQALQVSYISDAWNGSYDFLLIFAHLALRGLSQYCLGSGQELSLHKAKVTKCDIWNSPQCWGIFKGNCQKRFSRFYPLRGGYPPFPLRKKSSFLPRWFSVKGGGRGTPQFR